MTHPIGKYTNYTPGDTGILDDLQQRYGSQLELMNRTSKLTFRAALAAYLVSKEMWSDSTRPEPKYLVEDAIENVNSDIWESDNEVTEYICRCKDLGISDIEGLIEAITNQIRYGESDKDFISRHVGYLNSGQMWSEALFNIGFRANVLGKDDTDFLEYGGFNLDSEQRCRVINWLIHEGGFDIPGDLTLHIFGRDLLTQWRNEAKFAYPDCEMVLMFRKGKGELEYTFYFQPQPGCPDDINGHDFPLRHYNWESWDCFWGNFPNNTSNEFRLILSCYSNQESWSVPGTRMEDYRIPALGNDPVEADHKTIVQLLGLTTPQLTGTF